MAKTIFGTFEWATHNINILNGCNHDCRYCYSKEMAVRFKRKTIYNWKEEELIQDISNLKIPKNTGTIMFPSSHDLSPYYINEEIEVIRYLLENNKNVLLVTKPHINVIQSICDIFTNYKDKILFRFTIGSMSDDSLIFWEPNAPTFSERFESLKLAYNYGYLTSVSCEPMLDDKTSILIETLQDYITDSIWIGKPNFLLRRLKINGFNKETPVYKEGVNLLNKLNNNYINSLYEEYKYNNKIKWKESIKKIIGIELPIKVGLDI